MCLLNYYYFLFISCLLMITYTYSPFCNQHNNFKCRNIQRQFFLSVFIIFNPVVM